MGRRKRTPSLREQLIEQSFPKLKTGGYSITSPPDSEYNCVAWAVGDDNNLWWPDPQEQVYWPEIISREETLDVFIQLFKSLGYKPCQNSRLKKGFEKVAIFVKTNNKPTHAARQLPSGEWTSKLGQEEDIVHKLRDLTGYQYGAVAIIMEKPLGENNSELQSRQNSS